MKTTLGQRLKSAFFGMVMGLSAVSPLLAQTATLLPNAVQQYVDDAGVPLASGSVGYYVPNAFPIKKTIWQDAAKTTPQTNPVPLDAAGRPQPAGQTYGDGCYLQVVEDTNNVQVWSAVTCSTGNGGGTQPAFSEGVMVGTIIPWANTSLPGKYLYTAGQAVSRTTYAQLLTAITIQITILCPLGLATISVPTDVSDKTPVGSPVEFSCFAPGTTVISKSSGQLTLSSNATTTASVAGVIFPWGNGNGSTTFNVPFINGRTLVGRNNMGGTPSSVLTSAFYTTPAGTAVDPNAINAPSGSQSRTLAMANLPASPAPVTATAAAQAITVGGQPAMGVASTTAATPAASGTGYNTFNSAAFAAVNVSTSAVTNNTANLGTGTGFTVIQPSLTVDYIIKALPDDTPGGPGVTSIGGMTGAITCGFGIVCNANTLTVAPAGAVNTFALFSTGNSTPPAYRAITGADLPNPTTLSPGGIFAKPQVAGQVIGGIDTTGTPQQATSMYLTTNDINCLTLGRQGLLNPVMQIDCSTASQTTGIKLTGQSSGNGFNIETLGSDTNVPLIINSKGNGTINFGTNSTGNTVFFRPLNYQGSTSGTHIVQAAAVAGSATSTWPTTTGTVINTGATNAVTNAMLSDMANSRIKCRTTAGTGSPEDCTSQQVLNVIAQSFQNFVLTSVNFNTANNDNILTLPAPPTGFTRYSVRAGFITGASASLNPATMGVFTAPAAGGVALVASGTAVTVTSTADSTANNMQVLSAVNVNTASNLYSALTSGQIYIRTQTASAVAATASVTIQIEWLP